MLRRFSAEDGSGRYANCARGAEQYRAQDSRQLGRQSAMDLAPGWLLLSLIPSGAGFVLFVYGKKQQRWPQLVAGLALMVYPYFTTTVTTLLGVGIVITGALWYALSLGY
jgi:hypothetical protein